MNGLMQGCMTARMGNVKSVSGIEYVVFSRNAKKRLKKKGDRFL